VLEDIVFFEPFFLEYLNLNFTDTQEMKIYPRYKIYESKYKNLPIASSHIKNEKNKGPLSQNKTESATIQFDSDFELREVTHIRNFWFRFDFYVKSNGQTKYQYIEQENFTSLDFRKTQLFDHQKHHKEIFRSTSTRDRRRSS